MALQPISNYVLVKVDSGRSKKEGDSPFTTLVVANNTGVVAHSSDPELKTGTTVHFVGSVERLMIHGVELVAMKKENIVAVEV